MFSKILVAVDGSAKSNKALKIALEDIAGEGTEIHVVHVLSKHLYQAIESEVGYDGVESPYEIRQNLLDKEREKVVGFLNKACEGKNIGYELHVLKGDPRHVILDTAEEIGVDLIVVGSYGKGLGERLILGSVSNHVISHSKISTLVIK
ncbi:universal stress protein [Methanoplanus endosymbiosus]|uniref:Universal stress protein n=1 Tax=Methanoplanus endosymbiosus TaxID=33865 RepID=A0A9E7PK26_9EURY|nr:universal stress protein [Methanoplanus endosymbiosus]UUX91165.1 universal stress protein [Methanoplanus endosymbiosus]